MRSHACMVDPSTCDAQVLFFGGKPLTRVQEQVIWCRNEGDRVNFRTWIYFNYLSFEIHSLRLVDVPTFGDGVCCVAVRARAMHRSWRTCRNKFSTMCGAHLANMPATKYYHYLLS
jgi:hypothetical protein